MRKILTSVLAIMVLLSLAVSAEAFESKVIYRDEGMGAYADWYDYADNVYSDKFIQVMETDDGTDIYVYCWTYDENTGVWSNKWGYLFTQEDVFRINKNLNFATLSPVKIEVTTCVYEPDTGTDTCTYGETTIAAQWTGEGDVIKSSSMSIFRYDDFMLKYSDDSMFREATATGSVDGQELGPSDKGELVKFKSVSMSMEK